MQYGKPQFGMQRAQANALRNTNGNFGNQFGGAAGPMQPQPPTPMPLTQPGVLGARPMQPMQPGPHPIEMPQPMGNQFQTGRSFGQGDGMGQHQGYGRGGRFGGNRGYGRFGG